LANAEVTVEGPAAALFCAAVFFGLRTSRFDFC
jgi:hypothetical protein